MFVGTSTYVFKAIYCSFKKLKPYASTDIFLPYVMYFAILINTHKLSKFQ